MWKGWKEPSGCGSPKISRVLPFGVAVKAKKLGICTPIVLGTPKEIAEAEAQAGVTLAASGIQAIDYTTSELLPKLAAAFFEKRKPRWQS